MDTLDSIRQHEFTRLSATGGGGTQQQQVYLDHAGSALYSEHQLDCAFTELRALLLCNPHRFVRKWLCVAGSVCIKCLCM